MNDTTGFASGNITVRWVSNANGGSDRNITDVTPGTTIAQLFGRMHPGQTPGQWFIRVNRQPTVVAADYVMQNNDYVSVTPQKITGA